jgi:hypothetical protein
MMPELWQIAWDGDQRRPPGLGIAARNRSPDRSHLGSNQETGASQRGLRITAARVVGRD